MSQYIVGIDLGTTHTVVAYAPLKPPRGGKKTGAQAVIRLFEIEQPVGSGEVAALPLLPSCRYHAAAGELAAGALQLPWPGDGEGDAAPVVMGQWARQLGAQVPGRLVASAKSWLSHPGVDRRAAILPVDAPPDLDRVLEALQAGREFFPFVVAEIGVTRPSRDDQVIVANLALRRLHDARLEVDRLNFREHHLDVFILSQNPTHGPRDVRGRESSGGDLVEKRLEKVIIRPVDNRDANRLVAQVFGGLQATKSSANNDNPRRGGSWAFHRQMIAGLAWR